jgi:hypothetical protein
MTRSPIAGVVGFASRLRFPWLLALTAAILVADLLVPDLIPFVDEILLALATLVLAGLRKPRSEPAAPPGVGPGGSAEGPVIDVDPEG